jgi:bacterioferritin
MIIPNEAKRKEIVDLLIQAYWMEVETVASYIANSINPDGVRAKEIKSSLAADITAELSHAQLFGKRIKELYGRVPGSMEFRPSQTSLQPAADSTDLVHVIKGVIEAEQGAINHYRKIIAACEGTDYVSARIVVTMSAVT